MKTKAIFVVAVILAIVACSKPKLNSANEQTVKASLDRMTAGMNDQEKAEFESSIVTLIMQQKMGQISAGEKVQNLWKEFDGMTAEDIQAKAETFAKEMGGKLQDKPKS